MFLINKQPLEALAGNYLMMALLELLAAQQGPNVYFLILWVYSGVLL
jgi:hypothetical protein